MACATWMTAAASRPASCAPVNPWLPTALAPPRAWAVPARRALGDQPGRVGRACRLESARASRYAGGATPGGTGSGAG